MAWFPGCIRKEITRHRTPLVLVNGHYRGVVFHIAASEGASLFNYFNQPGNPTSHFYIRYDGTVEQYVDTQYRAPAELEGNPTMISIETQGGTASTPNQPDDCNQQVWTADQFESLAQVTAWLNQVGGMPLNLMPNSLPSSGGLGYHRLGIDPWRVSGGETWSNSFGKDCPCTKRIGQIPAIRTRTIDILEGNVVDLTPQNLTDIREAVWGKDMAGTPASTIMVRINPGPNGIGPLLRDKPWEKITPDALTGADQTVLDLLRFAQGDSRHTSDTLSGGGDLNNQIDRIEGTLNALDVPTAQEIAEAVVALLQPGEITQAEVEAAIHNVMTQVWCPPPVTGT